MPVTVVTPLSFGLLAAKVSGDRCPDRNDDVNNETSYPCMVVAPQSAGDMLGLNAHPHAPGARSGRAADDARAPTRLVDTAK